MLLIQHVIVTTCSICERVGMDWTGSPDSVICCDNVDVIYHTFFLAMKDYTLDSRGDVGLWWDSVFQLYVIDKQNLKGNYHENMTI